MILVPRSDLFRPCDFYGFDRFEISHFLPFLSYNQSTVSISLCLSPAKMGHLEFALFSLIEVHILAHEDVMNV